MNGKLTLSETIQKVHASASSIFTKEDVLKILEDISYTETTIEEVRDALTNVLDDLSFIDFVDDDTLDFYVDGKEIHLQHFEFNTKEMTDMIIADLQEEIAMRKELDEEASDNDDEFSDAAEQITETVKGCGDNCQCKKKKKKVKKH